QQNLIELTEISLDDGLLRDTRDVELPARTLELKGDERLDGLHPVGHLELNRGSGMEAVRMLPNAPDDPTDPLRRLTGILHRSLQLPDDLPQIVVRDVGMPDALTQLVHQGMRRVQRIHGRSDRRLHFMGEAGGQASETCEAVERGHLASTVFVHLP